MPHRYPKLYPGPCNSVGMRPRTDRQTHTQTLVITVHFASSTTHAKCNKSVHLCSTSNTKKIIVSNALGATSAGVGTFFVSA